MWNFVCSTHVNNINIEVGESLRTANKKVAFCVRLCAVHRKAMHVIKLTRFSWSNHVRDRVKNSPCWTNAFAHFWVVIWSWEFDEVAFSEFYTLCVSSIRLYLEQMLMWIEFIFSINCLCLCMTKWWLPTLCYLICLLCFDQQILCHSFYSILFGSIRCMRARTTWNYILLKRREKKGFEKVIALTKTVPPTKRIVKRSETDGYTGLWVICMRCSYLSVIYCEFKILGFINAFGFTSNIFHVFFSIFDYECGMRTCSFIRSLARFRQKIRLD